MLGAELYVLYLVLVFHSSASLYTATASGLSSHSYSRSDALNKFFDSIDQDGDGQIQAAEASQYIDATFDEHELSVNPTKAAQQMSSKLDGSDPDATVSKEEVEKHLKRLLKVSPDYSIKRPRYPFHKFVSSHTRPMSALLQANTFLMPQRPLLLAGQSPCRMAQELSADASVCSELQGQCSHCKHSEALHMKLCCSAHTP